MAIPTVNQTTGPATEGGRAGFSERNSPSPLRTISSADSDEPTAKQTTSKIDNQRTSLMK